MAPQPAVPSRPAAVEPTAEPEGAEAELAQARRLGRLEAEAVDRRCREHEQREREARLAAVALGGGSGVAVLVERGGASPAELARLRSQVDSLGAFHASLLRSRSWRLLQALRRPFGRTW
jgi:hypothetical protein